MPERYQIKGVAVAKYSPSAKTDKAPIIMVHGGNLAGWCWENWAVFFSKAGYEVHVLDWYNHGESDTLPEEAFIRRGIADIAHQEITYVADELDHPPIVIGHSMGGLATALYTAAGNAVTQLVLLAPVMPIAAHPQPIPLPVDMTKPAPVFPYEQAKQLFFTTLSDIDAKHYYELLVPESPQAVSETVNWSLALNPARITVPTFVMASELDRLIPGDALKRYAKLLHATYQQIDGVGHCDLLLKEPEWRSAAQKVETWLRDYQV